MEENGRAALPPQLLLHPLALDPSLALPCWVILFISNQNVTVLWAAATQAHETALQDILHEAGGESSRGNQAPANPSPIKGANPSLTTAVC